MSRLTRTLPLFLAGLFFVLAPAQAQEVVYSFQSESALLVDGTSNKSDWTVEASEFDGFVRMNEDAAPDAPGIAAVSLTIPAAKIVSGKSTIMDRLMQRAFKTDEHPEITYELTANEVTETGPASFTLHTTGNLTMAGTTNEVEVDVKGERLDDGQVRFTGSYPLKMTDYGMDPPTAMFGALRTGDEVTVRFDLVAVPQTAN